MRISNLRFSLVLGMAAVSALLAGTEPKAASNTEWLNNKLVDAVREGNLATMKAALDSGANPNTKDAEGTPAVMIATLYASAPALELLLDRGADPNAFNAAHASALIWAAGDADKVRTLLSKGADPNLRSGPGRTALLTAASRDGSYEAVKMLVEKGADINAKDSLEGFVWSGGGGATPLIEAAKTRDIRTVRYLLDHGADVNAKDHVGGTALSQAALRGSTDIARLLIERGADVHVKVSRWELTPLIMAAQRESVEMVDLLLAKGAPVDGKDITGATAIMWAAYSDHANPALVTRLLAAGADPAVKNKAGETAMTWASRRGETPVVALLRGSAPAPKTAAAALPVMVVSDDATAGPRAVRDAMAKSLAVMDKGGPQFFKVSGCISCHNQTLPLVAGSLARKKGVQPNEQIEKQQFKSILAIVKPATEILAESTDILPDIQVTGGYVLEAFAAQYYAPDATTAAVVHNIAAKQMTDGSWIGWSPRPPIENGDIQATALCIRSLRLYGLPGRKAEFEAGIARAGEWLRQSKAVTLEEKAMKLFGLRWANANADDVNAAAEELLAAQREDGGWAQLATLSSDAYATGKAMVALYEAGALNPSSPAYRRGVAYLMNTQQEDGSWLVKTRAFPFQPLKDSGFPHGRDQWISAAGTGWASMALSHAIEDPQIARR